jgi:hypothetical protein
MEKNFSNLACIFENISPGRSFKKGSSVTLHFCNVPKFGNILYANEGTTFWQSLDFGAQHQPVAVSQALKSRKSFKAVPYPIHMGYFMLKLCGKSSRCRAVGKQMTRGTKHPLTSSVHNWFRARQCSNAKNALFCCWVC